MSTPEDPARAIADGLAALGTTYQDAFAAAADEPALRNAYASILGKKKGALTKVLALMRHVPAEARRDVGAKVNTFKKQVEEALETHLQRVPHATRICTRARLT